MFKIYDGRNEFYQWDLGRKLILSDPTVEEVHFCNKTSDCSLVVAVYDEDGLRLADVPNILLQTDWPINVYAYCGDGYTKTSDTFKVARRSRPDDYVYTETQVKRWEDLEKRIDDKINYLDASEAERATAENERIAAENERIAAEESRVVAEEQRNENFGTLSTDMDAAITKAEELTEGLSSYESTIINQGECITAIEAKTENHEKRITNIERHISQDYFVTDDTTAYNKAVPVDVCPYAQLNSIGGMTYKCKNLIPYPYTETTKTENGITFTDNGDGTIAANGKATNDVAFRCKVFDAINISRGTYTFSGAPNGGRINFSATDVDGNSLFDFTVDAGVTRTVTINNDIKALYVVLRVSKDVTVNNAVFKPMLNEGTTALPYEPYYEGLRDSKVTEILSVGANLLVYPYRLTTYTKNGITFTDNGDGSITLKGTAAETFIAMISNSIEVEDGTYTIGKISNAANKSGVYAQLFYKASDGSYQTRNIFNQPLTLTMSKGRTYSFQLVVEKGTTVSNVTVYPMLNKGSTAAPYVPYREPISYPIPKALQDIDGWGQGLRSASANLTTQRDFYNTYDFSAEQYTQWTSEKITIDGENVKAAALGSATGEIHVNLRTQTGAYADYTALQLTKFTPGLSKAPNTAYLVAQGSSLRLNLFTTETFATIEEANEWLKANPIEVIYAFDKPIITDIPNDNFIEVESGGSLEFVNEHKNAVPSSITYLMKEGSI